MIVVCSDAEAQAGHAPEQEFAGGQLIPYPESPARYASIHSSLDEAAWADLRTADPVDDGDLAAVHDQAYLKFLQSASAGLMRWPRGGTATELTASVFAHPDGRRPVQGRASVGYYGFDTTPITGGAWPAALAAAAAARTAAELVLSGQSAVYSLARPPGHHAGPATFGGYCYLNHAAVAARRLSAQGRVAVVDIDYHHGNGTQQIFYDDDNVFFLSLHADPVFEYPCYWGYADETGHNAGAGCNLNVPLPAGVEAPWYLTELRRALQSVARFDPCFLVVSVGFDTYVRDPLGTFRLDVDGYPAIAEALIELCLPTVIVQEGGYHVDDLGLLATRFLEPFDHHNVGRS